MYFKLSKLYMFIGENGFFCWLDMMLYVPVNSYGHVGMLHPFYGTSIQNKDVMTSKKCFKNSIKVSN